MSYEGIVAIALGVNLMSAVVCAFIAARRGRDPFSWVLTGALIGPFALVALFASAGRLDGTMGDAPAVPRVGYRRVIVPVDGSPESLRAVERAIVTLPEGATVTLLTVLPVELADESHQAAGSRGRTEVENQAADRFRAARAILTASQTPFDTMTCFGNPAEEILAVAANGCEMIVIGRRGHGLTKAVLGSVSDRVLRDSPCPVTVA